MTQATIRKINGAKQYGDLVGVSFDIDEIMVEIVGWDKEFSELKIAIDGNKNGLYKSTEIISMAFGEDIFLSKLRDYFGIEVVVLDSFEWSEQTASTMRMLNGAGFSTLAMNDRNEFFLENKEGVVISADFLSVEESNYFIRQRQRNLMENPQMLSNRNGMINIMNTADIYLK